MSDVKQAQRQNLERIADAPPTQPQSLPEAPTMQQVRDEAILLSLSQVSKVSVSSSRILVQSLQTIWLNPTGVSLFGWPI